MKGPPGRTRRTAGGFFAGSRPVAAALMLACVAPAAHAADRGGPPTCALLTGDALGLDASPLVGLLEVELSRNPGLSLLERIEVQRILEEQKLQLALSPEGGEERVALGKLLKADLLVILQAGEKEARYVDLVVCETEKGLRLLVRKAAWTDDPKADAEAIQALVTGALGKHAERIEEICAVPPFVSRDLTHDYDHLQSAYARLIEQALLRRRGMLVVDLAEARAVARELELAGGASELKRKLPLYILGEYRNEGLKDKRRITVGLALRRGENELAARRAEGLLPDEAASFILRGAAELMVQAGPVGELLENAEPEARQLAERAEEFQRLGFWKEALELLEASLLLRRDHPQTRREAVRVAGMLARAHYDPYGCTEDFTRKARRGLMYYKRGVEHLESFLLSSTLTSGEHMNFMSEFWAAADYIQGYARHEEVEKIRRLSEQIERQKREMILRVTEEKARSGDLDDATASVLRHYPFYHRREIRETADEHYAVRFRAIYAIRNLPRAAAWTKYLATTQLSTKERADPPYGAFVRKIAAIPSGAVRSAAAELLTEYERSLRKTQGEGPKKRPVRTSRRSDPAPAASGEVLFRKLRLSCEDRLGRRLYAPHRLSGWLPCGEGVDAAWTLKEIYVMKTPGVLRRIFKSEERFFNIVNACYDGKYFWAPVKRPEPLVLVVDPESEEVHAFTREDGVPPMTHMVAAAPLDRGKICLSGCFGKKPKAGPYDRSWIATLEFSPRGKSVDVFHEAPIQATGVSPDEFRNVRIAFIPSFMVTLIDSSHEVGKRVLLWRSTRARNGGHHPLLVDPEERSVAVIEDIVPSHFGRSDVTGHDGGLYWANRGRLERIGFPDFQTTTVARGLKGDGVVAFYRDRVNVAGRRWWTADKPGDEFAVLDAKFPRGLRQLRLSHHYGLLLLTSGEGAFSVEFPEPTEGPNE